MWHLILKPFGISKAKSTARIEGNRMSDASRSVYPHIRERSSEDDHLSLIEMNNVNEESIEMLLIIKKSLLSDANVWRDYLYVSHIF